ncbi:MAG: DUF5821 family protein, partial [Haloglomus sp.]
MTGDLLGTTVGGVLRSVFERGPDGLFVVNPSADTLEGLVETATHYGGSLPILRVLADARLLKSVMDDFLVAANAADLVESAGLSLRTLADGTRSSILVTDDEVIALVEAGNRVGGLVTDDASFVAAASAAVESEWEAADAFNLRTPALSRVERTLADELGPAVESDFEDVLASLETARGDGDGLDEVTVSLLVAARNRVLL